MKTVVLYFVLFQLFGCALFDSGSDNLVDGYQVGWVDLIENRSLDKQEELVPAYVFAVGHDTKFIYAKQHPLLHNSLEKIDKSIVNYYIIERTKSEFQDKLKYGPLTKKGFDSLCIRLDIQRPKFDMNYPTNLYWQKVTVCNPNQSVKLFQDDTSPLSPILHHLPPYESNTSF